MEFKIKVTCCKSKSLGLLYEGRPMVAHRPVVLKVGSMRQFCGTAMDLPKINTIPKKNMDYIDFQAAYWPNLCFVPIAFSIFREQDYRTTIIFIVPNRLNSFHHIRNALQKRT